MEAQVCRWYASLCSTKKMAPMHSLPSERASVDKLRVAQSMITYIELLAGQRRIAGYPICQSTQALLIDTIPLLCLNN